VPNKQPLSDKTTNAPVDPNYGNTFTYTKPSDIKQNYLNNVEINPRVSFNYDINGDQSAVFYAVVAACLPVVFRLHGLVTHSTTMAKLTVLMMANAPITAGYNPLYKHLQWWRWCCNKIPEAKTLLTPPVLPRLT
jgi:hypothetical protein